MSEVYYNEFDDFAASWLRELIADGLIPKGHVDQRSVLDVEASDLKDFKHCHFFAGIGGWAYAARLAQWPADRPIWTGSPPCQPFSVAGKQEGAEDKRHLWPVWFDLIRELKPPTIFGEQVSSSIRHGWLDTVQENLEAENYAVGSIVLPASSVGAHHRRERLWFVANSTFQRWEGLGRQGEKRTSEYRKIDWGECYYTRFRDGKCRAIPTEPEIFPLAHGIPNRVGILRGAGNAIVPQVAAEVIKILM